MAAIQALIGMGVILTLGYIFVQTRRVPRLAYYCDSCGRHLGAGRRREKVCPRCGDYRYYTRPLSEEE